MFTAGDTAAVENALKKLIAVRLYQRSRNVVGVEGKTALEEVGLAEGDAEEMYRLLAIAKLEDRYVVSTTRRMERPYVKRGVAGYP